MTSKNSVMKEGQDDGNLIVKQKRKKEKDPPQRSGLYTITCMWSKLQKTRRRKKRKSVARIKAKQMKRMKTVYGNRNLHLNGQV